MSTPSDSVTRRDFLSRVAVAGVALSAPAVLAACGGGGAPTTAAACEGYASVPPAAIQMRQTLQYVDATPDPTKNCANCKLYNAPAAEGACGGCQLFAGPVIANGYCTGWAAMDA